MRLRPYQMAGRDFLAARKHALLADEMRLGKSGQAILAAQKVGAENILVVCPAIAVPHWISEFEKWWPAGPEPVVRSYDRAKIQAKELLARKWDVFIPDEAHFAKNPTAQRTKLVYGKGGLAWASDRTWPLTGTPAPKHAAELWPMLRAFGVTPLAYDAFLRRYCDVNSFTLQITGTKERMIPELKCLLATVMLRRMRREVAPDMPEIDFQFLEVLRPLDGMGLGIDVPELPDDQLATWLEGHPTVDRENRVAVAAAKGVALAEQIVFAIENGMLQQTVVFGWHLEPLHALAAALGRRGLTGGVITGQTGSSHRVQIQEDFRAGKIQVVVAQILAAGTAIDLSAASHGYFLELDWVGSNNLQAASRLVNLERKRPVTFDIVTWPGSADDRVQRIVRRRMAELRMLGLA